MFRLAKIGYDAAKYACANYHYSKTIPSSGKIRFGVYENDRFIGAIVWGRPAGCPHHHKTFGITYDKLAELLRVALRSHVGSVTEYIAISIRILRKENPHLRLLLSFADEEQGHVGKIYQAGNWFYLGRRKTDAIITIPGLGFFHNKTLSERREYKYTRLARISSTYKYKYAYPLDGEMRELLKTMAKPYPKMLASEASDDGHQPNSGGVAPTRTLQ